MWSIKYYIVFLLWIFESVGCSAVNKTENKLIFAQIIFRHGDRSIVAPYKNDPYKDKANWPQGFGQLTNFGKQREYELGKYFRTRYEKLLGDGSYNPDKVFTVSAAIDRIINSASLVLAGLFPPQNNQIWNEYLLWQPIPVYVIPIAIDYLIKTQIACLRYTKLRDEYRQSAEIREILNKHQELLQYLETHAGQPIRDFEHIRDLWDIITIENTMNKTLPDWTQKVFVPGGDFNYLNDLNFKLDTGTSELKKLKSGFLFKEILERFKNKTLSILSPNRSLWLYSGQDTTIASMLNTIGLFELHTPPYSSSLLFELYESCGDFHVQIFYRKSNEENPAPLNIPNCGTKCPLDRLFEIYSDILPTDFETECKLPNKEG